MLGNLLQSSILFKEQFRHVLFQQGHNSSKSDGFCFI
uniref:Uncharacterized protein n=1 Tax=Arundo donax TaxID=35708 RepID=A0A0A9C209_ARUDO